MPLTTIQALENGPYKVQGAIRAIDMDGDDYAVDVGDVYLCRCGGRRPSRSATARTPASASRHPSARLATHPRDDPFATHNGRDRLKPSSPRRSVMRSVVLSMIISLDGFIVGPERELDWMIGPDPEREAEHLQFLEHVDTMLIGHGVYDDMVGYWPTATSQLADRINATHKLVISTTPEQLEWQNARQLLVDDDLPGAIGHLKAAPGRDIVLYGGVRLAQSMTRHDLIDEYRLAITPVALGKGLPLFPSRHAPPEAVVPRSPAVRIRHPARQLRPRPLTKASRRPRIS